MPAVYVKVGYLYFPCFGTIHDWLCHFSQLFDEVALCCGFLE